MLELADRHDSGSCVCMHVGVQVPFPAPFKAVRLSCGFLRIINEGGGLMKEVYRRIEALADEGSIHYIEKNQSAVVVASAKIAEKPVVLAAFDPAKKGGALGYFEGASLVRAIHLAGEGGAPLVLLSQSAGADMVGGQLSLSGAGSVFRALKALDTPRLYLSYGPSIGAAAYMAGLCDVVLAVEGASAFCLTGPKIVARAIYEETNLAAMGGAKAVAERGGIHLLSDSEEGMAEDCRSLMAFLRQKQATSASGGEAPATGDMAGIIRAIVDEGSAIYLWPQWAQNATALLGRIGGMRVGIFANNPKVAAGVLDKEAALKAAAFYNLCRRFRLPVISLADTPGFLPGTASEGEGVLRAGSAMIEAYFNHDEKKITVAVGNVLGGAYMAMGCREMGASAYFALNEAKIGVMGADLAAEILHFDKENLASYRAMHLSAAAAQKNGLIDEILTADELRYKLREVLA